LIAATAAAALAAILVTTSVGLISPAAFIAGLFAALIATIAAVTFGVPRVVRMAAARGREGCAQAQAEQGDPLHNVDSFPERQTITFFWKYRQNRCNT
jgi:hypothetical protein